LIFRGNSSHAEMVIKMMGCGYRESCRDLFKEINILPLKSQYIYSLIIFVIKTDNFVINSKDYYEVKARQNINLHMHQVNLAIYGKEVYHMAVKVFNGLPYNLKEISDNPKSLKLI
jgi:hypothetical protein